MQAVSQFRIQMSIPVIVTISCKRQTKSSTPHALRGIWFQLLDFGCGDGQKGPGSEEQDCGESSARVTYLSCGEGRVGTDSCRPTSGPGRPVLRPRQSRACSRHPAGPDSVRWPRSAGGDCAPARWLISPPPWCPMLKWLGRDLHKLVKSQRVALAKAKEYAWATQLMMGLRMENVIISIFVCIKMLAFSEVSPLTWRAQHIQQLCPPMKPVFIEFELIFAEIKIALAPLAETPSVAGNLHGPPGSRALFYIF